MGVNYVFRDQEGLALASRYITWNGSPFLLASGSPWSIVVQLTEAQMATYLDARQAQGFTGLLVNLIEHYFSSQSPLYQDVDGNVPFTGMAQNSVDFTAPVSAYWSRVDTLFGLAKARGMMILAFPAYLGFGGGAGIAGDQGWDYAVNQASAGDLQTYGAWLANRYGPGSSYGNVIWAMGGDYDAPDPSHQWNIATGIRSVDSNAIITYHGGRTSSAYDNVAGYTGFNLNNVYSDYDGACYALAATEFERNGPIPFIHIEGAYGNAQTAAECRRQYYHALLSGACGFSFGTYPVWSFGDSNGDSGIGAASALSGYLDTTEAQEMAYAIALFSAYSWHLLAPQTGTALVTTALGTSTSRICPALASDGSFALIYTPSANFTVDMTALTPSSVRARWYDPTAGTYSADGASPLANTGTHAFTAPGERVLVLDAA